VIVEGNPAGQTVIQGEGAGPEATTSALISDLSSVMRGNTKFPFVLADKERKKINFENILNIKISAYLRLDVIDKHGVLSNITDVMAKNRVSIKRLIQNPYKSKKFSSIIIITHKTLDRNLNKALKELNNKRYILKKPKLIRIENI
jgi:homoserine dehydrogenase